MTTDRDDQLLRQIARRNWIILALLFAGSLAWRSVPVAAGVLAGGIIAIVAYYWRYRSLRRLLNRADAVGARSFQIGYLFRLVFVGSALYLLIVRFEVHPVALVVGLSIVVLNVFWTTLKRSL